MRIITLPLTKRDVDGVPPGKVLWDSGRGGVTGFGIRRQKDARVFVLKYSVAGKARWYTIGRFGSPWTVDAARSEAKRLLGEVARGNDPADKVKSNQEKPINVSDVCDRYLAAAQSGLILTRFNRPKKSSTLIIDVGRIDRHIKPLIGQHPLSDVDARCVKRMISDIAAGKTAYDAKTKSRGVQ